MKKTLNNGYVKYIFEDEYEIKCSLEEGHLSSPAGIWLGIEGPNPTILIDNRWVKYEIPDEVHFSSRMFLTENHVKALLPFFRRFLETSWLASDNEMKDVTEAFETRHTHCVLKEELFENELTFPHCEMVTVRCPCNCYVGTCLKIPLRKYFDVKKEKPILQWSDETLFARCTRCNREIKVHGIKGHIFWMENVIRDLLDDNIEM